MGASQNSGHRRLLAVVLGVFLLFSGTIVPASAQPNPGVQGSANNSDTLAAQDDYFESCVWDLIWKLGGVFTDAFDGGYALAHATDLALQGRHEEAYGVLVEAAFMFGVPVPFKCFPVRQVE